MFGFLLGSVRTSNGYLTCFGNKHWADKTYGRAPVIQEIIYGPALKDCKNPPPANRVHKTTFTYVDSTATGFGSYFAPVSHRFGAPLSANNLLTEIRVFAADFSPTASAPAQQGAYRLSYQLPADTETRLPRLAGLAQHTTPPGRPPNTRLLRQFSYGGRKAKYDPTPKLLDVGADARLFPTSLSGSVTRPMRQPELIGNPNSSLYRGDDQVDGSAPPSYGVSQQWGLNPGRQAALQATLDGLKTVRRNLNGWGCLYELQGVLVQSEG